MLISNDEIMFLKCINNIIYLSDTFMCLLIFIHEMQYSFPHCLQLNLDETWYKACSGWVGSIGHYVSQQNTLCSLLDIDYNNYIDNNQGRKLNHNFWNCKSFQAWSKSRNVSWKEGSGEPV